LHDVIRVLACDKSLNKRQVDMVELAAAQLLFNKDNLIPGRMTRYSDHGPNTPWVNH
jgi:hypothetical protein